MRLNRYSLTGLLIAFLVMALFMLPSVAAAGPHTETFDAHVIQIQYLDQDDKIVRFEPSDLLYGLNEPFLLDHDAGRTFEVTPWACMNTVCEVTVIDVDGPLDRVVALSKLK